VADAENGANPNVAVFPPVDAVAEVMASTVTVLDDTIKVASDCAPAEPVLFFMPQLPAPKTVLLPEAQVVDNVIEADMAAETRPKNKHRVRMCFHHDPKFARRIGLYLAVRPNERNPKFWYA
jgi:hypothetical protein